MNQHELSGEVTELIAFSGPALDEALPAEARAHLRRAHDLLVSWANHLRTLIRAAPGGLSGVAAQVGLEAEVVRDLVLRPEEACLDHFFLVLTALEAAPAVPAPATGGRLGAPVPALNYHIWPSRQTTLRAEHSPPLAA